MKRAILAIAGTVAGLVALLSFKTHPPVTTSAAATAPAIAPPTAGATPSAAGSSGSAARTVTGDTIDTRWGPVQVRVTLAGGKITKAEAVQLPDGNSRDQEINGFAVPQLTQEALSAQSGQIDAVSGATYTSDGYIQSLQSALDRAGR
ncbi:MAG: hypothetical protein JWR24_1974 [Actinoallomurus sp.]|jgi:uncharacterized protein with FMN-binding domain|nr:hypothetical protein [Actinoallomurus sp.]